MLTRALVATILTMQLSAQTGREGKVARDGFDMHYRAYGSGSPILILSGGPGFDPDYLEPVARELAKDHESILVELRGTGRSLPPKITAETINVKLTLEDLEAIRSQMRFERWTLLGHSAGAVVAMAYAGRYPDHVASLILANSGPIRRASAGAEMDNILMGLTPEERDALAKAPQEDFGQALKILLPGYFYDRAKANAAAPQLTPDKFHQQTSALLGADIMGPKADLRPALASFSKPVLVIAGRQDPLDPAVQYEIHLALKNSKLRLLERCGHFSWIEQPEEFYRALREFLTSVQ
jgi:proline iminopeptidase